MDKTREDLVKQSEALRTKEVELGEKHYAMLATDPAKSDCWGQYVKTVEGLRQAEHALEMFDLRTKAKARLMVKLLVSAFSAVDSASIGHARIMASTAVDAMTDDEVLAVEW